MLSIRLLRLTLWDARRTAGSRGCEKFFIPWWEHAVCRPPVEHQGLQWLLERGQVLLKCWGVPLAATSARWESAFRDIEPEAELTSRHCASRQSFSSSSISPFCPNPWFIGTPPILRIRRDGKLLSGNARSFQSKIRQLQLDLSSSSISVEKTSGNSKTTTKLKIRDGPTMLLPLSCDTPTGKSRAGDCQAKPRRQGRHKQERGERQPRNPHRRTRHRGICQGRSRPTPRSSSAGIWRESSFLPACSRACVSLSGRARKGAANTTSVGEPVAFSKSSKRR